MPPRDPSGHRPLRADARRNRDLLLTAAKELFAERGADAPLDDVARRAGVGNATMYRHFPTRRDLVIAVYSDEVTELCARGEALLTARPPDDALVAWLEAFAAHVETKRELALSLADDRAGRRSELFDRGHEAMRATAEALLDRARRDGTVRPEIGAADLLALANGIALTGDGAARARRLLGLVRRGATAGDSGLG